MPFSSLRFGQFCDFRPKVCFSTSGSKRLEILSFSFEVCFSASGSTRFEILLFSSGSLTPSIFLH
ncbi:hypothetical protein Hanom_Chr03g00258321 [Helianthus anomalus]